MYGENKIDDFVRFSKAFLTNNIARFAPKFYVKMTKETGRGRGKETNQDVAKYFLDCFNEYFYRLKVDSKDIDAFLNKKVVLEYGPGDIPAVAILMYAHGAKKVYCVDRFPLVSFSQKNLEILTELLSKLDGDVKKRANECFNRVGEPVSGLDKRKIEYLVKPGGITGLNDEVDFIISRAVLEHVNNLNASIKDMEKSLKKEGLAIHKVDLKSHGLHKRNHLDFLTWPDMLWKLMYSHKGAPNRYRIKSYLNIINKSSLNLRLLEPVELASLDEVKEVKPRIAKMFQDISDEHLTWLSFWLVLEKNSNDNN